MTERDKVIKGLDYAWEYIRERPNPTAVPKAMAMDGIKKGIALLKEQEAVEPKKGWFLNNLNIPEEHWFCGKCDEELAGKGKYCANCGQAVKWE